ncbi:hypothetical protein ACHAXT_008240 [Thalassiosira profunda]
MDIPETFPGPTGQIITALQVFVAATSYSTETNAKTRAQYSKFSQANAKDASAKTWPSRAAMMVIYTPAFVVSSALLFLGLEGANLPIDAISIPAPSLAALFCAIHFAKRCLEVLFVHKYSGRTDRGTPTMISVVYALYATLVAYAAGMEGHDHDAAVTRLGVGTTLFSVGIAGNFYHHYLLARLRSLPGKDAKSKYVAPRGGLFRCVACPHYLFELFGWLGIAIAANHVNVYLLFAGMTSYLAGRSVAQNDFNRRTFNEKAWPHSRKNLIPFVF